VKALVNFDLMKIEENMRYTRNEEQANAISHLTGTFLAIFGTIILMVKAVQTGSPWHIVSCAIFGFTMILLYFSSTMTHWLDTGKAKEFFFTLDQIAIFFLIAGTYTPLALIALHGPVGWIIFGLEWGLAIIGITIRLIKTAKFNAGVNTFYIILYALMGWMLLIAVVPTVNSIGWDGLVWILLGGICYTVGIYFYKKAKFKYNHLVWHLLVIAGTIFHFYAVYQFMLPIKV
jgi:hemolysin III